MKRSAALSVLMGALVLCFVGGPFALAAGSAKVTGGGLRVIGGEGAYLSINAIQKKDGTVTGQFEQHDPDLTKAFVHGTVSCLDFINDTTVLVSGLLTDVHNVPAGFEYIVPGAPFLLYIEDNGNGAGADRVSYYFVGDVGSPFPCGDAGFIAFVTEFLQEFPENIGVLASGNFQVSR